MKIDSYPNTFILKKGFNKYLQNSYWLLFEQALRIVSSLFIGVWVARHLGPSNFGVFSYAIAFASIFGGLAKLGLDNILIRDLVKYPTKQQDYLGTSFWLKFLGALLVFIGLLFLLSIFKDYDDSSKFILIISIGLFFQSFEVIDFYFQSKENTKTIAICKSFQLLISSVIKVSLILTDAELIWFVYVILFDAISLAMAYAISYFSIPRINFLKTFKSNEAKSLLTDSWPLIVSSIVVMVYMRIDQIMIQKFLGDYEVGIYSAAIRISESFYFLPMTLNVVFFPAIVKYKFHNSLIYKKRIQQLYTLMIWLAFIIALPINLMSDFLINILFGTEYSEASAIVSIHVWAMIFAFLGVSFSRYLIAENLGKIEFKRTLLGAFSNVFLNLWLIPVYGIIGAAIATLISQLIANLIYDLLEKKLHEQLKIKLKALLLPWSAFKKNTESP